MKGVVLLSEGRTGSSWLTGMANSSGVLGDCKEWFAAHSEGLSYKDCATPDEFLDSLVQLASGKNDVFMVKIFPPHHRKFHRKYGCDPIRLLREKHEIQIITLARRDTLGQAISFAKAYQSKAWGGVEQKLREPEYDFDMICRFFVQARHSAEHWQTYLDLQGIEAAHLIYEDLLPDGRAFLDIAAAHCGVAPLPPIQSKRPLQRNATSEEWRTRFHRDIQNADIFRYLAGSKSIGERWRALQRKLKKS